MEKEKKTNLQRTRELISLLDKSFSINELRYIKKDFNRKGKYHINKLIKEKEKNEENKK